MRDEGMEGRQVGIDGWMEGGMERWKEGLMDRWREEWRE